MTFHRYRLRPTPEYVSPLASFMAERQQAEARARAAAMRAKARREEALKNAPATLERPGADD